MKIQEVLLRAMARKITWFQAAEFWVLAIGICAGFGNMTRSLATTGCLTDARPALRVASNKRTK